MDRRTLLKGGLVLAATSHAAANAPEIAASAAMSIDDFLKVATPAEIARYHTNALMEAMAVLRPDVKFAAFTDIDLASVQIVGAERRSKVKFHVDDGSPLLADDVTGTTAYADWERSRANT